MHAPPRMYGKSSQIQSTGYVEGQNQRSFHDTESLSTVFRASAGPRRERITINSRQRGFVTHGGNSRENSCRSDSLRLLSKPLRLWAFVKGLLPCRLASSQRCWGD